MVVPPDTYGYAHETVPPGRLGALRTQGRSLSETAFAGIGVGPDGIQSWSVYTAAFGALYTN